MNAPTSHSKLNAWVDETARLCRPDRIVWLDGSESERKRLEEEAVASGELLRLNEKLLPGCLYHRTAANDVARTEHLTYICTPKKIDAGPTNNWMTPEEGYRRAGEIFAGSMRGRTMYVIPFSMGVVGSPFSKIGVQLTDSLYVALNMRIMTRMGRRVLDQLGSGGAFTKCLHGKAELDVNRRLILHFPQDNTIWSVGSGYGGNALLGKKCLALRIASHLARTEGWLAEHMLILGIERGGRTRYVTAAFPSACGKTNLAMLIPPAGLKGKGYKIWTVGDDIAWLRIGPDGQLWAVNPENGFFGVAPGTNSKSNPTALATIQRNTIFTNVALTAEGGVWWENGEGPAPKECLDWRGQPWRPGMKDAEGKPLAAAHPNSRFTAPAAQCPSISPEWENPQGVPISAVIFGGRRERVAPLVYESFDWNHGVYAGATVASERTAAQVGKLGEVRRDPMAMLPFCGYNMADYFAHWIEMGRRIPKPPRIFHVNWFRRDAHGKFLWPGFGDNLRVVEWMLERCDGRGAARKTPIGWVPAPEALDLTGLDLPAGALEQLLAVDRLDWEKEAESHEQFFSRFEGRIPPALVEQLAALKQRLRQAVAAY
ncbi:MAG: phosphoenolpyruvate carboxykinase (GTP) [Elusimicrobia bacterium]|nr:phosphoenolpyruvate carboxykinase (GTP) [Elusimicrobiota bacterium]MDE2236911.1 phosphoenolpyruvate carboxykinase (GTP) [Elusimicrobiota bacterium]MDE2426516.1 phosphoenolpyruvate carboxykinase (GTP) [Elusimicrobiota bacterium]